MVTSAWLDAIQVDANQGNHRVHKQWIADLEAQYSATRDLNNPNVALEGFHAVKHALRFGVTPTSVVSPDPAAIDVLAAELAPDIRDELNGLITEISATDFARLSPRGTSSPIVAIGPRRRADIAEMFQPRHDRHIVVLENPRHTGNAGAVIRVAAAANAVGVVTVGELDPWSSPVLRGAAGLHYALSVASIEHSRDIPPRHRPLVALDPEGQDIYSGAIPHNAALLFGTERHGLSQELRDRASATFRLPMRPGVSSLNLATAVSAALFMLQAPHNAPHNQ